MKVHNTGWNKAHMLRTVVTSGEREEDRTGEGSWASAAPACRFCALVVRIWWFVVFFSKFPFMPEIFHNKKNNM